MDVFFRKTWEEKRVKVMKKENSQTDITGREINGFIVIRLKSSGLSKWWLCRHTCGQEVTLRRAHLDRGSSKLCPKCSGRLGPVDKPVVEQEPVKQRKKKEGGTSTEQLQLLREKNNAEVEPKESPTIRKTVKLEAWELGKLQAYAYVGIPYRRVYDTGILSGME